MPDPQGSPACHPPVVSGAPSRANPLIQIETLPNSNKRLNLIVANKLVITGLATVTTATVSYAKQYCTVGR